MRKYHLNLLLIVAAVIFIAVAALTMNRVVIATLFLALLAFIAVSEGALRRSRRGMAELVEAGLVDSKRSEEDQTAALDAFGFAAVQDPDSPLRDIEDASQALQDSYGHLLDDKGKEHLQRIRAAGQRMAHLTDDLVSLFQLYRQEMHGGSVDLSATARDVAAELQRSQPDRQAEFVIENGLVTEGDRQMLRVVLENLLGNSWKFTAQRSQARIEFNANRDGGKPVYYVRDNGVGFDNEEADRLFSPFQRLSNAGGYEGSGVGLAGVRQIIHRHGGSIWAEAKAGEGATFYFTLRP